MYWIHKAIVGMTVMPMVASCIQYVQMSLVILILNWNHNYNDFTQHWLQHELTVHILIIFGWIIEQNYLYLAKYDYSTEQLW